MCVKPEDRNVGVCIGVDPAGTGVTRPRKMWSGEHINLDVPAPKVSGCRVNIVHNEFVI